MEAELDLRQEALGDHLRRLGGAAEVRKPVVLRDRLAGLLRLLDRVADDDAAALERSLDLRLVTPDLLAPAALLLVEHPAHQFYGLVEPVQPLARALAVRDPEGRVLGLEPGAADAEVGAAA